MYVPNVDLVASGRSSRPGEDASRQTPGGSGPSRWPAIWIWLVVVILLGLGFAVMPELVGGTAVS